MGQLDQRVASAFYGRFTELRPVQQAAICPLVEGKSLILSAGTGSGKTEAVMAPLVSRMWNEALSKDELSIVYIAPTKALVNDLEKRLAPPLENLGLRIGIRHGDRDDLSRGKKPHVILTTPESLDILLSRGEPALSQVRAVVIDEAHQLYNNQRGFQLSILLRRLSQVVSVKLQTVMLSATIGDLSHFARFFLGEDNEAELLPFSSGRPIDAHIRCITDLSDFHRLIKKLISGSPTKLLVFADARKECERLAGCLSQDKELEGIIFSHYSSLSPEVRLEVEQEFSRRETAICFATSTLELGIDIGDINAVILWGVPGGVESFLQRIGRGNRRAGKSNVICFIPDHSESVIYDALRFLALLEAARKGELPVRAPFEIYGAVVQQALSVINAQGGRFTPVADLCRLFDHQPYLQRPTVEEILGELAGRDYLKKHGFKNRYGAGENLFPLVDYRLIFGNFSIGSQHIDVYYNTKHMGEVPAVNLLRVHRGQHVRFAGKIWRVSEASAERIKIEPSKGEKNAVDFTYPGARMGWDSFLTTHLWKIFHNDDWSDGVIEPTLRHKVKDYLDYVRREWPKDSVPYLRSSDGITYFTFAGYLINKALALASGKYSFVAKDITLTVPSLIEWPSIPTNPNDYEPYFDRLFEANTEQTLYQSLLPIPLQKREYLQSWLKDQTIPETLQRLQKARGHQVKSI